MADRITLEFGPWEPDAALLGGTQAMEARNVIPAKRGYRSLNGLQATIQTPLAEPVLAVYVGHELNGTMLTEAATTSGIYEYAYASDHWEWQQKHSGVAVSDDRWFAQYGDALYALYGNALLKQAGAGQNYVPITTAEGFAYDAPTGELLAVIRDFLVLGRAGGVQNCIRWSGIDRPDEWPTPGTNAAQYIQSDQQVFPEGGRVMAIVGAVGGTDGLVFMERSIQRMTYVGTPYIFQFDPVDKTYGTIASRSPVNFGTACAFLAEDGWRLTDGAGVRNIGAERVDEWFFSQCDSERLHEVRGLHDPQNRLAVWSFPTAAAPAGVHDRLLIYSYLLDKWSYATAETEALFREFSRGMTLEELDGLPEFMTPDGLDVDAPSLDSPAFKSGSRMLGAVTTEHKLGTFVGPTLEALIDTSESGGERMMLHGLRPLVDSKPRNDGSTTVKAMPIYRYRQQGNRLPGIYSGQMRDGVCYQHISCVYCAARVNVPAGTDWQHAVAVEALVEKEGGL